MKISAAVWEKSKMYLMKIINENCKYRSQQPNLNKLELGTLGTLQTKYEWFLVSGFIEDFFTYSTARHRTAAALVVDICICFHDIKSYIFTKLFPSSVV